MNIQKAADLTAPQGYPIPGILITPDVPRSAALVLHHYGGGKEQMLGLAFALAEQGVAALAIDSAGHGENSAPIGPEIRNEVEAALAWLRQRYGCASCTGLSLGGRLAIMSSADRMVAISPSVVAEISAQGKWMFENFPSPAVREPYSGYVIELLQQLGPVAAHDRPCLLLYGERDIPNIMEGSAGLKQTLARSEVRYVTTDLRPDVKHDNGFIRYLPRWFNHLELKFNAEVCAITAGWLAGGEKVSAKAS
jgi:dienelactone hydrolase